MALRSDFNHEDHLRRLLDQRAARADLHGRFPSTSDFSDSPSVYSHAHFSPRPVDRADHDARTTPHIYSTAHRRIPSDSRTDRQRLNIPDASSLDMDDEHDASYPPSIFPADEDNAVEDISDEVHDTQKVAYGPKMTVHSRAPWETGEEDNENHDEQESVSAKKSVLYFSRKDNSKKSRGREHRQDDSRPSIDSIRSQSRSKQSIESSSHLSVGGALTSLTAQASMSATSLSLAPSPQTGLRNKLSIPRFRSRTPSNRDALKAESADLRPYQTNLFAQSAPRLRSASPYDHGFSSGDSRPSSDPPSPNTPLTQQERHPYANPDLVRALIRPSSPDRRSERVGRSRSTSPPLPSSETNATITESGTVTSISGMSQSRSTATVITPDSSTFSVKVHADHSSRSYAKGISAPITINNGPVRHIQPRMSNDSNASSQRDGAMSLSSIAGWQESSGSSAPIKLISLEEAQARERSRSGGAAPASSSSGPSRVELSPAQSSWARVRAVTSSSSKVKNLMSTSSNDLSNQSSDISSLSLLIGGNQRAIVRKRSGFMRLFNGKDKVPTSPPPVPSLPVTPTTASLETAPSSLSKPASSAAPRRKPVTPRVPVPSLTPSLLAESEGFRSSLDSRSDDEDYGKAVPEFCATSSAAYPRERQISARRNLPGLHIVTVSSSAPVPGLPPRSPIAREPHTAPLLGGSGSTSSYDSSGHSPEFTTLNLRRVSAMFDAVFTEGLHASPDSAYAGPALSSDNGTPTSGESGSSPQSLPAPFKPDEDIADETDIVTAVDDRSALVHMLQEQILTARKAWQHQIWELESQVRDLKIEVDDLRAAEKTSDYCSACGRGHVGKPDGEDIAHIEDLQRAGVKIASVVNRPRIRTGVGSRFGSST